MPQQFLYVIMIPFFYFFSREKLKKVKTFYLDNWSILSLVKASARSYLPVWLASK